MSMQQQQQQQQQQKPPQQHQHNSSQALTNQQVIELESRYLNPNGMMSMLLLRMQIRGFDEEIQSGRLPQELVNFKCQLRERTRTQLKSMLQKQQSGQINADMYLMCVRKTRAQLIELKQQSNPNAAGEMKYMISLAAKAKSLMQEEKTLSENKDTAYVKIIKIASLDIDTSIYDKIDIDRKPFNQKIKIFLTRYFQYKNLVLYFSKHMKEQMKVELGTKYLPMLTKMRPVIDKLKEGENVPVNSILTTELVPITKEMALGMSTPEYIERLQGLTGLVNECLEIEKKFKLFSRNARRTKLSNHTALSAMKIKSYNALLDSLNSISNSLTPLPFVEVREETRNLFLEDKAIDPIDFILSISKLTGCAAGQYSMTFSLEIAGQIVSDALPFCDANSLEWNYTKKFARGIDIKQLDDQLHTRAINVIVFKKTFFSKEEYARATVPLADLETKSSITLPVTLIHKKDKPILHMQVKMRFCTKLFSPLRVKTLIIQKQFEPINLNENLELSLLEQIPERFRDDAPKGIGQSKGKAGGSDSSGLEPCLEFLKRDDESKSFKVFEKFTDDQVPFGLTLDELKNPEDFKVTFSLNYLTKMYPQQQQASSYYAKNGKIDERKRSLKLAEDCLMRKFFMEESFMPKVESGAITIDQVYSQYCEAIVKDRLRIKSYLQLGLTEWAAFSLAKRQIYIQDMKENEWEIEDVVDINIQEIFSSLSQVQLKEQALANLPIILTFLRRGVNPEEGILRNLQQSQLPKGLSMEEALQPEDLTVNYSEPYLNIIIEQYSKAATFYAKSGLPNEQKQATAIKEQACSQKQILQQKMGTGDLDMEDINNFYQNGIVKDRLRVQLYTKIGLYSWVSFAMAKRMLYIADLKENEIPIEDPELIHLRSFI